MSPAWLLTSARIQSEPAPIPVRRSPTTAARWCHTTIGAVFRETDTRFGAPSRSYSILAVGPNRRTVCSSRVPWKNLSSTCSNTEPGGVTAANSVAQDRSFMSSGEPNTSAADRPSMATAAAQHSVGRAPRMGCRDGRDGIHCNRKQKLHMTPPPWLTNVPMTPPPSQNV